MGTMKKIFVIHGWSYAPEKWQPVADKLGELGFDVKILKVPGLDTTLEIPWNLDDYVKWLKRELGGEQNVVLIGHSNGGRIALKFTAENPSEIGELILVDSAGIMTRGLGITSKRKIFKILAKVGKLISSSEKLRKLLYKIARESDYEKASPVMRQTMANLISVDLEPVLAKISVPTLIIWGENDMATPLKDGKLMHDKISKSKFEIISGAGHSPHVSHQNQLVEKIVEVIR